MPLEGSITIGSIDSSGNVYRNRVLLYPGSTVPKGMRPPSGVHSLLADLSPCPDPNISVGSVSGGQVMLNVN